MNVGVVAQVTGPGLEHAEQADLPTKEAGISGKLLEGGRRGAEEDSVQPTLVLAD